MSELNYNKWKGTVCLDFDGVCNTYKGKFDKNELHKPLYGLSAFVSDLISEGYRVAVYSQRSKENAYELMVWWHRYKIYGYENIYYEENDKKYKLKDFSSIFFPAEKPIAKVYVDDNAVVFKGNYKKTFKQILRHKPYWKKESLVERFIKEVKAIFVRTDSKEFF